MLHIDYHEIDLENSVTVVLDIKIDTALCYSTMPEGWPPYIAFQEIIILLDSFIISKFKYCPLMRNPDFMRTYFEKDPHCVRRKEDLFVNRTKTTELYEMCLKTLRANIWNSLAEEIKDLTSLPQLTEFIKTW